MNSKPLALKILDVVSLLLLLAGAYLAIFVAPTERVMGDVQRVFYFHIGTAWVALVGFVFTAVLSVIYLVTKDHKWDRIQVAAVEVSVVFFLITIILGSIWARPAWNTWWTWDPRLTTAAITELIYIAYFMLRQGIDDPDRRARFCAVRVDRRVERADHVLCHPALPHHPPRGHWDEPARGGGGI